jgi:hypothetical protein
MRLTASAAIGALLSRAIKGLAPVVGLSRSLDDRACFAPSLVEDAEPGVGVSLISPA